MSGADTSHVDHNVSVLHRSAFTPVQPRHAGEGASLFEDEIARLRAELDEAYALLEGKENDLHLSATYGKRLIEDNAALGKRLDSVTAELSAKIEVEKPEVEGEEGDLEEGRNRSRHVCCVYQYVHISMTKLKSNFNTTVLGANQPRAEAAH